MYSGYGISVYTIFYYGIPTILSMLVGNFRIGNDYTNANSIGLAAATACIIQFYLALRKEINWTVIFVLPSILMLAVSQSRKASVMVIVGIVFLTITCSKDKGIIKKVIRLIVAIILLFIMIYALSKLDIFAGVFSRFQTYFESRSGAR